VAPLIALLVVAAGTVAMVYPTPPAPQRYAPYVAVAWLLAGVVLRAVTRARFATHEAPGAARASQDPRRVTA